MNYLGLPAGNVPARLAELPQGPVPIGVQIVGRRWREDLVVDAMVASRTGSDGSATRSGHAADRDGASRGPVAATDEGTGTRVARPGFPAQVPAPSLALCPRGNLALSAL
jgi:hypothetical protein